MLEKALVQRLERKSKEVMSLYETTNDWLETAYQLLFKYMGFKVNNEAFLELAKALPLKKIQKHRNQLFQLEALLFGHSGLVIPADGYSKELLKEYGFLASKYQLDKPMEPSQWKFLRLRPPNFPTVRLAQLAAIIHKESNLFSLFIETKSEKEFCEIVSVGVSVYWQNHYHFSKEKTKKTSGYIGKSSLEGILINVVIPLKFAYAIHQGKEELKENAFDFLSSMEVESNNKVREMTHVGFELQSASDSQAAIELLDSYCKRKQCLQCAVGLAIIKSNG